MSEGQGQRSRSPRQKYYCHGFRIVYLANDLEVKGLESQGKGHMGQGQRLHGLRSLAKAKYNSKH